MLLPCLFLFFGPQSYWHSIKKLKLNIFIFLFAKSSSYFWFSKKRSKLHIFIIEFSFETHICHTMPVTNTATHVRETDIVTASAIPETKAVAVRTNLILFQIPAYLLPPQYNCGSRTNHNSTYFVNNGYPSSFNSIGQCSTTIEKVLITETVSPNQKVKVVVIRLFKHQTNLMQDALICFYFLCWSMFSNANAPT